MSDELRNLVRGSAENVSVPSHDLDEVVGGGRSLKWRKRLYAAGAAVLVAALTWTSVPALLSSNRSDDEPPVMGSPTPAQTRGNCAGVTFRATYLPEGWSYAFQEGTRSRLLPVNGKEPLGHFGPADIADPSSYVEIYRYGDTATLPDGEGEPVHHVPDEIGVLGEVGHSWVLEFHSGGCRYSMIELGVSKAEFRLIAKGLEWADRCARPRLAGPDIPLEDGRHFGYIEGITNTAVQFDEAEFLTGEAANEAAVASGAIEPGDSVPNDYFIVNEEKGSGAVSLSSDVKVTIQNLQGGMPGPAPADVHWLICAFTGQVPSDEQHRRSPYWITVKDYEVRKIEEQYLP